MSIVYHTVRGPVDLDEGITGFAHKHRGEWAFTERVMSGDTHKALLLVLDEIKPCAHEKHKVSRVYNVGAELCNFIYVCECGAEVEPQVFVEVKK